METITYQNTDIQEAQNSFVEGLLKKIYNKKWRLDIFFKDESIPQDIGMLIADNNGDEYLREALVQLGGTHEEYESLPKPDKFKTTIVNFQERHKVHFSTKGIAKYKLEMSERLKKIEELRPGFDKTVEQLEKHLLDNYLR